MSLLPHLREEMARRSKLLPQEVSDWVTAALGNVEDLGIHVSQFQALRGMMDGLFQRQGTLLEQLSPALPLQQFAEAYNRLLVEVVGAHDLWRVFRYIFGQLGDERIEAACLVAADCYRSAMDRARTWGLVDEAHYREPPLAYMDAEISPATASRGYEVEALGFPQRIYRHLRLPIPIVLLPADQVGCLWLYCSLHHEVGHNLDQDLGLEEELRQHLDDRLHADSVPAAQRKAWGAWTGEMVADALGVLLGGAGFGHMLAPLLAMLAPLEPGFNPRDEHPHPLVRIPLLASLLRGTGVPALVTAAEEIEQRWGSAAPPDWADPYVAQRDAVAAVLLTQSLAALGGHPLQQIVPDLPGDADRAQRLAKYLRTGLLAPNPAVPQPFPMRLVPAAAQLALVTSPAPDADALDRIQERGLAYLQQIPRPQWMAAANKVGFYQELVAGIDFMSARHSGEE